MSRPQDQRPLSPHVGIYRWQLSNGLSILHRVSGVGLSFGLILFAAWLSSAAYSADCFARIQELVSSPIGKILLLGWTVAFFYHLGNGIRHLFWDMGMGFTLPVMNRSGILNLIFTVSMTVLTWSIVLHKVGL